MDNTQLAQVIEELVEVAATAAPLHKSTKHPLPADWFQRVRDASKIAHHLKTETNKATRKDEISEVYHANAVFSDAVTAAAIRLEAAIAVYRAAVAAAESRRSKVVEVAVKPTKMNNESKEYTVKYGDMFFNGLEPSQVHVSSQLFSYGLKQTTDSLAIAESWVSQLKKLANVNTRVVELNGQD